MPTWIGLLLFAQTILYQDGALYRLKSEVTFKSDLGAIVSKYTSYRCHRPKSLLFTDVLKNKFLKDIEGLKVSDPDKSLVLDLLRMEKVLLYAGSQELGVSLKNLKLNPSCKGLLEEQQWKNFLSFEHLIETRFSKNGELLRESIQSLIDTIDHQYPHEIYL